MDRQPLSIETHRRRRIGVVWIAALVTVACRGDEVVPGVRSSVGALPANTWVALDWGERLPAGLRERIRGLLGSTKESREIAPIFDAERGSIGLLAPHERGAQGPLTYAARIRTAPDVVARVGDALPATWRLAEREGAYEIERDDWPEGFAPVQAKLAAQSWFQRSSRDLGPGQGVQLFLDLSEARSALRSIGDKDDGGLNRLVQWVPGLTSIRSLAARAEAKSDLEDDYRLALTFARTPTGITRALAVDGAPLTLVSSLEAARGLGDVARSALVLRADPGVLIDSIGAMFAAGGVMGVNPVAMLRRLQLGKVLMRDFWASFGFEWGLTVRSASTGLALCAVAPLRDRKQLLVDLEEIFGEPGRKQPDDADVLLFRRDFRGFQLDVYVGVRRCAIATRDERDVALRLVGAASAQDRPTQEARNAWFRVDTATLRGRANAAFTLAGEARRTGDGLVFSGTVRRR